MPTVNRASSPYGAGWMVAGVQRLHVTSSGVVVDEGTGAASFFRQGSVGGLVSPTGDRSTLAYETATSSYRRTWPDGSGILFASTGHPVYRYSPQGDTTWYTFSGDRLTFVTDPAGKSFQLLYDGANKLQRIVDPQGRTAWITVTGTQLTQIIDYDGVPALANVTYELNAAGNTTRRVSGWTDRAGGQWNVTYDVFGTPVAVTAPQVVLADGSTVRPRTTATSEKTRVLTGSGNYPASGRPRALPADAYAARTDARGYTTHVWSDRFGLPLQVNGPLGHGTTIERDTLGNPLSVTTPEGTVRMSWTVAGDLARSFDERSGVQTDYGYQAGSGGTFLIRSSQGTEDVSYDRGSRGEILFVRVGPDTVARYTYDARTRVSTATDAGGHVTQYFYDGSAALNTDSVRIVTATGSTRTSFTYDAHGRAATVRNAEGTVATTGYDDLNRVLRRHVPGDSVRMQYFGGDSLVVVDAVGKRYHTGYNRMGWTVSQRDPQGRSSYVAYDSAGNAVRTTDRHGRVFVSDYDALGRVTRLAAPDDTVRFAFDNPGSGWVAVSNAESTDTLYREDGAARMESVMGGHRYGVRSAMDHAGRLSAITVWRGDLHAPAWVDSTTLEYDARGRLALITDPAGGFTGLRYDAEGLMDRITYPNSIGDLELEYSSMHRLISTQYSMPALQSSFGTPTLGYDVLNRLKLGEDAGLRRRRRYDYDALGRLEVYRDSLALYTPPPPGCGHGCSATVTWRSQLAMTFSYDAVGNRTAWTRRDSTAAQQSFGATLQPNSNRYDTYAGWTLQYDSVGNLVRRYNGTSEIRYRWNSLGQLRAVVTPTDSVAYGYNGLGMRVRRTVGGVTTRYLYDGDDLAVEVDASGNRIRSYTYYPGVDSPHSMRTWENGANGAVYYYALDLPTGNVRGMFDVNGTVTHRYSYTPFGEPVTATSPVANPLRFAARELDGTTGLYYVRARWYDPFLGRFVSEDPIGLAGGINNYAYALNDPVNLADPSGLGPCELTWGGWDAGFTFATEVGGCDLPWYDGFYESFIDQEFRLIQEAANPSMCRMHGCNLRPPSGEELELVTTTLDNLRTDHEFCRRVQAAGREMIARDLRFWDNEIWVPAFQGGGQVPLLGNAPMDSRFGGPVMYLYSKTNRRDHRVSLPHVIVHESVHGVINLARAIQPSYYADPAETGVYRTPLGTIDDAANFCRRRP